MSKDSTLPKVRNVNKDKRRRKKHQYKPYEPIAIKWFGVKELAYVEKLEFSKDGYATYRVRSVTTIGCIYYDIELDDPRDPYCYVSSTLTKSLTEAERTRIQNEIQRSKPKTQYYENKPKKQTLSESEKVSLKKQTKRQKDFINGNFW